MRNHQWSIMYCRFKTIMMTEGAFTSNEKQSVESAPQGRFFLNVKELMIVSKAPHYTVQHNGDYRSEQ